jgi:hypothetical protein
MSLATGQPWLFAGLGPSAIMVASSPGHPTTRLHSVVVGHLVGFSSAWLAVLLLGAGSAGALAAHADTLSIARVWASAFAVALTALVQPSVRAYHPPAAATALLVTLGLYHLSWRTAASLMAGVLLIALLGEWFGRVRLKEQRAQRERA